MPDTDPTSVKIASPARAATNVHDLTVVAPTFNESANVGVLVERLHAALEGIAWQVIFVDDNSPDGTAETVKAIAAHDPRVSCIRRVSRRGLAGRGGRGRPGQRRALRRRDRRRPAA